tara:strand:- start:111 stop:977 length:867 start_codon:yes stop_codon:yes gene_type:complete
MAILINLNGDIRENVTISAVDHGFLFGDSVYEVVCTERGAPCFLERHLKRLRNSAAEIFLKIPWSDQRFENEIQRLLNTAENKESYIRIMVTRGEGEIEIDPRTCEHPNVLIYVKPARIYQTHEYREGISVALVNTKRNIKEALNPGIKTGNYLNNIIAIMEAGRMGANEALMLNSWGIITECTTSNFFWVRDGKIRTPSLKCGILAGITRDVVITLAQENGVIIEKGEWGEEELEGIDEAFITGTVKRIMPVVKLRGKLVGSGKLGIVTQNLMVLYADNLRKASKID